MAIRLASAFGGSPGVWLRAQTSYDLWHAQEQANQISVDRHQPA